MQNNESIAALRRVYQLQSLNEEDAEANAMSQFQIWWQHAVDSKIVEPNAMILSTCMEGKPSSRVVLLKGLLAEGFIFFTNYESRKGTEIAASSFVSLLFFWQELERQIRIEGVAEKVSDEQSEKYFASRPRESQIGAWSSPQSKVIQHRQLLHDTEQKVAQQYADKPIPKPPFWGGYLVRPQCIEFWQGRPGRLHDRLLYTSQNGGWKIERLAP